MRVQQLLNAFRPGSRWSAADEREGRVRFQTLKEPNYGYERFTAAPKVNGDAVTVTYPFAPDSTIARFALPTRARARRLRRSSSSRGNARPSATVYRDRGERGATTTSHSGIRRSRCTIVANRGAQPFIPNGEMYGEFGTLECDVEPRERSGRRRDGNAGRRRSGVGKAK